MADERQEQAQSFSPPNSQGNHNFSDQAMSRLNLKITCQHRVMENEVQHTLCSKNIGTPPLFLKDSQSTLK